MLTPWLVPQEDPPPAEEQRGVGDPDAGLPDQREPRGHGAGPGAQRPPGLRVPRADPLH